MKEKKDQRLCLPLSKEWLAHLNKMSLLMSIEQDRRIGVCETIRLALEKCYPRDEQLSFI